MEDEEREAELAALKEKRAKAFEEIKKYYADKVPSD